MEETFTNVNVFSEICKSIFRVDKRYFDKVYDQMSKLTDYKATLSLSLIKRL
jgi:hypothetical protein